MADTYVTIAVVSGREDDRGALATLAEAAGLRANVAMYTRADELRARCEDGGIHVVAYGPGQAPITGEELRDLLAALPVPPQLLLVTERIESPDYARARTLRADDVVDTSDAARFEFVVRRGLRYTQLRRLLRKLRNRLQETRVLERSELQASEEVDADPSLVERIDQALRTDGLALVFQPIISLADDTEESYETFVRMRGDDGYVMPDEFLPVALRYGLLPAIDRWVVEQVVERFVRERERRGDSDALLRLFVHVSAHSLVEMRVVEELLRMLGRARPPAGSFVIKIDKDTILSRLESVKLLNRLVKKVGLQFAIDHFEASDTRLNYLDHISVDYIKLHGSLIKGIDHDSNKFRAVADIVAAARSHDIRVIASQVERGTELAALYRLGVDHAQGYLIAEPAEELQRDVGIAEVLG